MREQQKAFELIKLLQRRHLLGQYPNTQAEAVARHYCSMIHIALDLKNMVELKRSSHGPEKDLDDLIAITLMKIKEAHLTDLGIALEWGKPNES
jgi:uncharacterized protein YukJ